MSFVAVIPARWDSSRFPGKPLAELGGLPMVVRTAQRVLQSTRVSRIVVATDDNRILNTCGDYGVECILTSSSHATGTDRVVEAAHCLGEEQIVNVQGDEPLVDPEHIDLLIDGLAHSGDALVANAACPLSNEDLENPNIVKAVQATDGRLLCLSRCPIPFAWGKDVPRLRHLGMYAFRSDALQRFASRTPGSLEMSERIEMFRFLEHGDPIQLVSLPLSAPAVDVEDDLARVEAHVSERGGWESFA